MEIEVDGITYTFTRGFASKVTCSWADWLAHNSAIYWEPGQGRDCPRGAQPLEEVRLSTMPNMDASVPYPGGWIVQMIWGEMLNNQGIPEYIARSEASIYEVAVTRCLNIRWPRIKFVLPAERPIQGTHPPLAYRAATRRPARADTEETR